MDSQLSKIIAELSLVMLSSKILLNNNLASLIKPELLYNERKEYTESNFFEKQYKSNNILSLSTLISLITFVVGNSAIILSKHSSDLINLQFSNLSVAICSDNSLIVSLIMEIIF